MLPRDLDALTDDELRGWLNHLVTEQIPEGESLDYKRELNIDRDGEKRDLAQDVAAFANAFGGTIVYGIRESDSKGATYPAEGGHGTVFDPDIEQRLQNILTDAIAPRLPRFIQRRVSYDEGEMLVVWVPQSYLQPHMVQGYQRQRFYLRSAAVSRPMTEHEVEAAYERRLASRRRPEEFSGSIWADGPLLSVPDTSSLWAARYLLMPALEPTVPVRPAPGTVDYERSYVNWQPSPNGVESRYTWSVGDGFDDSSRPSYPDRYLAVQFDGNVILWDEPLFQPDTKEGRPVGHWAWLVEAERLDSFLRTAARAYAGSSFSSPLTLTVAPSVVGEAQRQSHKASGARLSLPPGARAFRRESRWLGYPEHLWVASVLTDTDEIAGTRHDVVIRTFDVLCRFFQLDGTPEAMRNQIRTQMSAG